MIKKHYYSWQDVEKACVNIALQMYKDAWRPDYIVGITRGGNVPATILSNMLDVRGETLKVSLRDGGGDACETNCWMAEDAFGVVPYEEVESYGARWDPARKNNILIIDDINDTGATFDWIQRDWQASCFPNEETWASVWGHNVRFAVITENLSSDFGNVNYYSYEVNKAEDPIWLVYPWENVGSV